MAELIAVIHGILEIINGVKDLLSANKI